MPISLNGEAVLNGGVKEATRRRNLGCEAPREVIDELTDVDGFVSG